MTGPVKTCYGDEELTAAMQSMREYRVRRLPVVDHQGRLCGMVTLNDLILAADGGVRTADVLETLRAICEHYRPAQNAMVVAA
jgi:CBS-domain-containing membrane protein